MQDPCWMVPKLLVPLWAGPGSYSEEGEITLLWCAKVLPVSYRGAGGSESRSVVGKEASKKDSGGKQGRRWVVTPQLCLILLSLAKFLQTEVASEKGPLKGFKIRNTAC